MINNLHLGIKFQCPDCDYEATAEGHMATHPKSVHLGIKFQCPDCDYEATMRSSLATNQKSVHMSIEFPYKEKFLGQKMLSRENFWVKKCFG